MTAAGLAGTARLAVTGWVIPARHDARRLAALPATARHAWPAAHLAALRPATSP